MSSQYLSVKLKMMMARTFGETLLLHQSGTRAREGETLARNPFSHLGLVAGALIKSLSLKARKNLLYQHIYLY